MDVMVEATGVSAETMQRLARALYATGRELYSAGTRSSELLDRRRVAEAMAEPRAGDLVFVRDRFDPDGVGRLLRIEGEFPREKYVIEPLHRPGVELGWRNCTVLALPEEARSWLRDRSRPVVLPE